MKAKYGRSRVNVKDEPRSTFTFTRSLPYIASTSLTHVHFTCGRREKLRESGNQPLSTFWTTLAKLLHKKIYVLEYFDTDNEIYTWASLSSDPRAMAPNLTLSAKLETEPTADWAAEASTSWDACAAETRFLVSSTRVLAVRRIASLQGLKIMPDK